MSGNFKIVETDSFREDIGDCSDPQAEKIYSKIVNRVYPQLRDQPYYGRNIKKLKGYSPETWRYRLGDYRIVYQINADHKAVILYAFALRKDAYK